MTAVLITNILPLYPIKFYFARAIKFILITQNIKWVIFCLFSVFDFRKFQVSKQMSFVIFVCYFNPNVNFYPLAVKCQEVDTIWTMVLLLEPQR